MFESTAVVLLLMVSNLVCVVRGKKYLSKTTEVYLSFTYGLLLFAILLFMFIAGGNNLVLGIAIISVFLGVILLIFAPLMIEGNMLKILRRIDSLITENKALQHQVEDLKAQVN